MVLLALPTTHPQAGLVSRENAEQLLIALEPEAASVYCRKLRLHQLLDLSSRAPGSGRLGERRSIDSSFRQGEEHASSGGLKKVNPCGSGSLGPEVQPHPHEGETPPPQPGGAQSQSAETSQVELF